jgi:hypothetical protein
MVVNSNLDGSVRSIMQALWLCSTDEFYYDLHEHTVGRTDNVEMLRKGKYIMHSPVYVWKAQTGECRNIDIAKVCAEELLEISIEKEDPLNRHHRFYENN